MGTLHQESFELIPQREGQSCRGLQWGSFIWMGKTEWEENTWVGGGVGRRQSCFGNSEGLSVQGCPLVGN